MADAMDLLPWTFSNVDLNQSVMNEERNLIYETVERREESLEEFMNILLEEDASFQPFLDINFLMRFLRGAKFKCSQALKRLKRYYTVHRNHPEIFGTFLPSSTLKAQSLNFISALPYRGKDNSIVLIHKLGKCDPNIASFEEIVRLTVLVIESLLQNPVTQLCGITDILDLTDFSVLQMSELSPTRIQTLFEIFDISCTIHISSVHVINPPGLINSLHNLVLPLISPSKKNRVLVHSSGEWEVLHSVIPPEILPEEYNGRLAPSELVNVLSLVNHNEDYFLSQMECGLAEDTLQLKSHEVCESEEVLGTSS